MKRYKGLTSLDLVLPTSSSNLADQSVSNEMEMTKSREEFINNDISKIGTSSRTKLEMLRANSPTFRRLVAVRIKLEKYFTTLVNTKSPSQQLVSNDSSNYPKETTTIVRTESSPQKRIKSKPKSGAVPLDRITYEKTSTKNGTKQKCSLEIWLPKAGSDDEDGYASGIASPDAQKTHDDPPIPKSMPHKSPQSNVKKSSSPLTIFDPEKSFDDMSSKKSESTVVPRIYHYEDYLADQPEERPRSGKSENTNKSDGNTSNKHGKRQRILSHARRISPTTNTTDETVLSTASNLPMSSKNLLANIKQTHTSQESRRISSSNSLIINELMRKYSMIKKNHQELTQPKLQIEKTNQDPKQSAHSIKDHSNSSPSSSDILSDNPISATRKLIGDNSTPGTTVIDRRLTHRKPSYSDLNNQGRLLSLVHHLQHRQVSAVMSNSLLPVVVVGKKNDESLRAFERSKTLDVVFALSSDNSSKFSSRLPPRPDSPHISSNILQRSTNINEQLPAKMSKRSLPPPIQTIRSEQPNNPQSLVQFVQYQNIQNSTQRYHHPSAGTTADLRTKQVLVHLKYSNGGNPEQNCLIPD